MRALSLFGLLALTAAARGQIVSATVDILSPGDEGYEGIPPNLLVLDVFVDVAETDAWTAAAMIIFAHHGAAFRYFDSDPNAGLQPGLFNPGFDNRFVTSLSKPRGRNTVARFENAGAEAAGPYDNGATPFTQLNLLSVAYFAFPPETSGSPSVDGYIARIAVDLSATPYQPNELVVTYTRPDFFLLECDYPGATGGFVWATFDVPQVGGMDFWLTVPEPAALALLLAAAMLAVRRRE